MAGEPFFWGQPDRQLQAGTAITSADTISTSARPRSTSSSGTSPVRCGHQLLGRQTSLRVLASSDGDPSRLHRRKRRHHRRPGLDVAAARTAVPGTTSAVTPSSWCGHQSAEHACMSRGSHQIGASLWPSGTRVGVTGLEPAASSSRTSRSSNYAGG